MSNYNYKGVPLSSILASGGSINPTINQYYQSFPPVLTTSNNNIGTINYLPYDICGNPITSLYYIKADTVTYNSSTYSGNFTISLPSWANSFKSSLTSKNGSSGTTNSQNIITFYNCPRTNNSPPAPYGKVTLNSQKFTADGGSGGYAGVSSIIKPYIFNSSNDIIKGTIKNSYVSINYNNNSQLVKVNSGGNGNSGNISKGPKGNNTGNISCVFNLPGVNNIANIQSTPGTYYRDVKTTPGTAGPAGNFKSNLSSSFISNSNISSTTSSIKVYFFNN
jgi:hypothetical protein